MLGQFVPDVHHENLELLVLYRSRPVPIQDPKCDANELLVRRVLVHLHRHHIAELGELDHAGTVSVELKYHVIFSENDICVSRDTYVC